MYPSLLSMRTLYITVIVITDGVSNVNPDQTLEEAKLIKEKGMGATTLNPIENK